jgi:hypothetical protein
VLALGFVLEVELVLVLLFGPVIELVLGPVAKYRAARLRLMASA